MRFLITGGSGYIASRLVKFLRSQSLHVMTISQKDLCESHNIQCKLGDTEALKRALDASSPDIIIHTAWVNSLVQCEKNPDDCRVVNVDNSRSLMRAITSVAPHVKVLFLSSDYVFDGSRGAMSLT